MKMKLKIFLAVMLFSFTAFAGWWEFIGNVQFDTAVDKPVLSKGMTFWDKVTETLSFYNDTELVNIREYDVLKGKYKNFDAEDQDITGFTNVSLNLVLPINGLADYSVDSYPAALPDVALAPRNVGKRNTLTLEYTITSGTAMISVSGGGLVDPVEAEIDNTNTKVVLEFGTLALADLEIDITDVSSATGLVIDDLEFSDESREVKNFTVTNSIGLEGNDGRAITADTESIPYDGTGTGWTSGVDGSTTSNGNYYTVQYSGSIINLVVGVKSSSNIGLSINIHKNGVLYRRIRSTDAATNSVKEGDYLSFKGEFAKDDKIAFVSNVATTLANDPVGHYLNIVETSTSSGTVFASDLDDGDYNWNTFTPTGTWTTNTTYTGAWRRVAGDMEIIYRLALSGAPVGGSLGLDIPNGKVIDNSTFDYGVDGNEVPIHDSTGGFLDSGAGYAHLKAHYNNTTSVQVWGVANPQTDNSTRVDLTNPRVWASGDRLYMHIKVPIVGWSANPIQNLVIENPNGETLLDSYQANVNSSYNIGTVYQALSTSLVSVSDATGNTVRITANEDGLIINAHGFMEAADAGANTYAGARCYGQSGSMISRAYSVDVSVSAPVVNNATCNVVLNTGQYIYFTFTRSASYGNGGVHFTVQRPAENLGVATGTFQKVRTAYIDIHASVFSNGVVSTTSYKTVPLVIISGSDSGFMSISGNQATLPAGKYEVTQVVGAQQNTGWVDRLIRNVTDASNYEEFTQVVYNPSDSNINYSTIISEINITDTKTFEFQTKSATAGLGSEYYGRITIKQILAR